MLPVALRDVPLALTEKGVPEYRLSSVLTCQPLTSGVHMPPLAQRLPLPNGSSATVEKLKLCVRSHPANDLVSLVYYGIWMAGCLSLSSSQHSPMDFEKV